jgi:quercetin dioxygenase-like cupin family protein
VPMRAGELWYINADQEHSVQNLGEEDRINLVMDCAANDWLYKAICSGPGTR